MKPLPILLSLLILTSACAGEEKSGPTTAAGDTAPAQPANSSSPAAEFDLQFLDAMKKHHESAVAMAKMAIDRAEDPKLRQMAEKMSADQQKEIGQLAEWRDAWFAGAAPADTSQLPGASSMSMDMSHMQSLHGHQFDMMFVDMMIPHHEGAVAMSCEAHEKSSREAIRKFAKDVVRAQEREISDLSAWKQAMKM